VADSGVSGVEPPGSATLELAILLLEVCVMSPSSAEGVICI
jgi:hypothetical protein